MTQAGKTRAALVEKLRQRALQMAPGYVVGALPDSYLDLLVDFGLWVAGQDPEQRPGPPRSAV